MTAPDADNPMGWHDAVTAFKRDLLARALIAADGNRTHAARALGLQRTYLLRLLRDFDVDVPRLEGRERAGDREAPS